MASKEELVELAYEMPADIAVSLGYDKLTDLHNEWIRELVFGEDDITIQGHRGSYKTTCLIVSFALIIVFFPSLRTLFLRKTDTDVAEVMTAVASLLRKPFFKLLAAKLYGVELSLAKDTTSVVDTNLAGGVSGAAQLQGLGCGASLTGKHADRIFTDDIVNVKDRVSAAERERIKLIYQELQNIKNRGGRIVNTGTPWHKEDAFLLMPNIHKYDCYTTGLMSPEEIKHIQSVMTRSLFAANYELKHIADEDAMFADPRYFNDPQLIRNGIGHIDAAYGGSDGTAFTCCGKRDGCFYVYGRLWPETSVGKVLPEILAISKRLKIGTIYTEKNADKGYLRKEIIKLGHPSATYSEHTNKYIKIATYLKTEWANVQFLDCPEYPLDGNYINEVLDYNEFAAHDDAPDSLASIIRQFEKKTHIKGFKGGI